MSSSIGISQVSREYLPWICPSFPSSTLGVVVPMQLQCLAWAIPTMPSPEICFRGHLSSTWLALHRWGGSFFYSSVPTWPFLLLLSLSIVVLAPTHWPPPPEWELPAQSGDRMDIYTITPLPAKRGSRKTILQRQKNENFSVFLLGMCLLYHLEVSPCEVPVQGQQFTCVHSAPGAARQQICPFIKSRK